VPALVDLPSSSMHAGVDLPQRGWVLVSAFAPLTLAHAFRSPWASWGYAITGTHVQDGALILGNHDTQGVGVADEATIRLRRNAASMNGVVHSS
jgi:hypothetical protein